MKQISTRRGFTLIELLVVVIIIGILAAIALPQYQKAVLKARLTEIKTFIAHVEKAMDLYVLENGYPSSGQRVPWDEIGIDVSSYCDSIGDANHDYECTAKNFVAKAPVLGPSAWSISIAPSGSVLGPSEIHVNDKKDGTKEKMCILRSGSFKAKPMCDALKANDSSWEVILDSSFL